MWNNIGKVSKLYLSLVLICTTPVSSHEFNGDPNDDILSLQN